MKSISRSTFIKLITGIIFIPILYLIHKLISVEIKSKNPKDSLIEISNNFSSEITFIEDFIIINKNNQLRIFSSKCTHLGCQINKYEKDTLICQCHGSMYSINGIVLKGPSIKNLNEFKYKIDTSKNMILILRNETI